MHMSNASAGNWGPVFMRFLENVWEQKGLTRAQFGKLVPYADSNFTNWARGGSPTLDVITQTTDALAKLGITELEVFVALGLIPQDQAAGLIPDRTPDIDEAIERDQTLDDSARDALRVMRAALRDKPDVLVKGTRRKR